jgi:hypothetical protein
LGGASKMSKVIRYKCNECGAIRQHIDMYNSEMCYDCWEKEQDEQNKLEDKR